MTAWLVVAPERPDDKELPNSAWIARWTIQLAPIAPATLTGADAVRAAFEQHIATTPGLAGVAFFGHGAEDQTLRRGSTARRCGACVPRWRQRRPAARVLGPRVRLLVGQDARLPRH